MSEDYGSRKNRSAGVLLPSNSFSATLRSLAMSSLALLPIAPFFRLPFFRPSAAPLVASLCQSGCEPCPHGEWAF